MNLAQWLGLSVLGAIITTSGSLLATVIKEHFFTRSFERWKRHQDRMTVYERFRDPLAASAAELANRLNEIVSEHPTTYLQEAVFEIRPERQLKNDVSDPYFQHYKLISTLYRFACFFGWLELYRQETTFIRIGDETRTAALQTALARIRSDVADGHINTHPDWDTWRDMLIFREELRAIGEGMIEGSHSSRSIIGYGKFRTLVEQEEPNAVQALARTVMFFFVDPGGAEKDFRFARIVRLLAHLVDLIDLLGAGALNSRLRAARDTARETTSAWPS